MEDAIEFSGISLEEMGALNNGFLRFSGQGFSFKNIATGKVISIGVDDIDQLFWQRLANRPGIKILITNGVSYRLCGFKDTDFNKISQFCKSKWDKELVKKELSLKGWNYGDGKFEGQNLVFEVDKKVAFEVPLSNVSNCTSTKSEVSLEFHINEECPVQLVEMRFHVPQDADKNDEVDYVEEFRKAIMQFAEVEVETDQPLVMLEQILCTTPRGRYDIKVFHNQLFFHGKTHDYKIPFKTITRMFLLPHKDNRHMFFALHINPPIRQGQTRYPFLVLEFAKDEMVQLELGATDEQLKVDYENKLEKVMKGWLYEIVAKLFRVLINSRIIIPGSFQGASGTAAISCAFRQSSGYLYPLEKGFVYIHKPPMYIRLEEIDNVHFARSDVSTRSFDFEIVNKSGTSILFSSMGKEEYNKLYDFVSKKNLKIRNAKRLPDKPNYKEDKFAGSDEEMDHYKEGLKQGVRDREKMDADDFEESDSEDEDFDVEKAARKQKADKDSSEGSGSEPEEEFDTSEDSVSDDMIGKSSGKTAKSDKPKKLQEKEAGGRAKGREAGKKRKKDPNAPKRNQTAFFHWSNENRFKIRKDGDSVTDTAVRAGQMWREMTDEAKKPYEKKAKEDKERYEREMRDYKANKPADEDESDAESAPGPSASSKPKTASKKSAPKQTGSPTKKVISREFVDVSDGSSSSAASTGDESEPAAKKTKKPNAAVTASNGKSKAKAKESSEEEEEEEESSAESTSAESEED